MFKLLTSAISILIIISMISCASCKINKLDHPQYTINSILPRESFVKIEVIMKAVSPILNDGEETSFGSAMASGSIIHKTAHGSYILTANHVCEIDLPRVPIPITESKILFKVFDVDDSSFDAEIFKKSDDIDVCIIFAKNLKNKPAVKLKKIAPNIGDMVYNVAAPGGFFGKNMMPILQGRYSGMYEIHAVYTIPAAGGSSGSPIVNRKGYLIGMIFAVHRNFNHVSFSPTIEDLYDFIGDIKKAPQNPLDSRGVTL